jgi:RimJ/RimL family protein N-acetyltransferase
MRTLSTARLVLEPQRAGHAAEMFGVLADPAIYAHENAAPPSVDWLAGRYARLESRRSPDGREQWLNWVVRLGHEGPLIGYVQATVRERGQALVAYEFNSRHWGQGYAGEALRALLAELAARWAVVQAQAVLKRSNARSLALLQRLGFGPGGAAQAATPGVPADECLMVLALGA